MTERLVNFGEAILAADLDGSATTASVVDGSGLSEVGNFRIIIDDELMLVTARSSNDLTVTRGAESTTPATHSTGTVVKSVLTAGGLTAAMDERFGRQGRLYLPAGGEVFADEFDDASLDAGWTRVDTNAEAHLTYTEAGGLLSLKHSAAADAAAPGHALMRSMGGASFPFTVQVGMRHFSRYATNYQMIGPILSNGVTPSAGVQVWCMPYYSTSHGIVNSVRSFNNWATNVATTNGVLYDPFDYHFRLTWTAANSFTSEISPNGVDWMGALAVSATMTPTHFGIAYSTWTIAIEGIATYYYVRTY